MALSQEEYIAALGDLSSLGVGGLADIGGSPDILNSFVGGGGRFGSQSYGAFGNYRPTAVGDPTYRSGFDYARSIAGGMPMSQVIAPGVSYSPEQPMGYTQAQLNGDIPVEKPVALPPPVRDDQIFVPPVTPPVPQVPDDVGFLGTGIGGVTIPVDRQQVPAQLPQIDLSGIDFSQIQVPEEVRTGLQGLLGIPQIDTEALKADILGQVPTFDPTGLQTRLGALESQQIPVFDPSGLQEQITSLQQRPGFDPSGLQEQIAQLQAQPGFDPSVLQEQITALQQRPGFDPSGLQEQIGLLQQQVPSRDDFMSIQQDIAELSAREIPQFDPTGLQQQINLLQQQPGFDPTGLQEQITQIAQRPGFDPTQLQQQIAELQTRPGFDPTGLQQQIAGLQENIGQITPFDPSTLQQRLGILEQQVPTRDDFMSIQQDINQLQTRPQFDPTGLQQQIGSLEQQIGSIPQFDPSGLQEQISSLQQRPGFDPSTLQQQITALQQRPGFDPSGIQEQISGLQQSIGNIPMFDPTGLQQQIAELQGRPGFDPSGIQQQISGLQQQIGGIPQFDPTTLQKQIAANQAAIAGIDMPTYQAPDLSGFATQEDIQAALAGIPTQQPDISGLLSRISELESSLSALQQPTGGQFSIDQQLPMGVS